MISEQSQEVTTVRQAAGNILGGGRKTPPGEELIGGKQQNLEEVKDIAKKDHQKFEVVVNEIQDLEGLQTQSLKILELMLK